MRMICNAETDAAGLAITARINFDSCQDDYPFEL
jgi:hypothetical protein